MNKELLDLYQKEVENKKLISADWSSRENLAAGKLGSTGAKGAAIREGALLTHILERSTRVLAKHAEGEVKPVGLGDKGKAKLADLVLKKLIIPNAKTQFPLLQKFRLQDRGSMVYGTFFGIVEQVVNGGYVGPDYILVPPRNIYPQTGRVSIADSDYCFMDIYVSKKRLEKELDKKNTVWDKKALKELLRSPSKKEVDNKTVNEQDSDPTSSDDRVALVVKITPSEKITFSKKGLVLKREDNKLGEIPVVEKWDIPQFDTIWGMSTLERGMSVQKAKDSLINLFHEGAKHFVFPPTIINPNGVVPSSIKWGSGSFWLERIPNSIRRMDSNPQGLATFIQIIQYLTGVQQNQLGTTTTQVSAQNSADPAFGKTPASIKAQLAREATRDTADKMQVDLMLEKAYTLLIKSFAKETARPHKITVLKEEVDAIGEAYPDVKDIVRKKGDELYLMVSPDRLRGLDMFFDVEPSSSSLVDRSQLNLALKDLTVLLNKVPQLEAYLQKQGKSIDYGLLLKQMLKTAGIDFADKIIKPADEQPQQPQPQQPLPDISKIQDPALSQAAQAIAQQAFGQQGGQATGQDYNAPRF